MALHLNLLHEEKEEQKQRQRDPLKIGLLMLLVIGGLMAGFYMWKAYQTLAIKSELGVVQRDWAKVEPKVTNAQKRAAELNSIINTTRVLDDMIDNRFFWAPFLERLLACSAVNLQFTSLDGAVNEETKAVSVTLEGLAAGREPRAAAEELRRQLIEKLSAAYKDVHVEFKALEDLDAIVAIDGVKLSTARYVLTIGFTPPGPPKPAVEPPARERRK